MEVHGCYPIHIDFCVCQQFLEFFMGDNLTQQPVVEAFTFQQFYDFITQMQFFYRCVFIFPIVGKAEQIVNGHFIEVCQLQQAAVIDFLEDVMIGAEDSEITGKCRDGRTVTLFQNGVWAL